MVGGMVSEGRLCCWPPRLVCGVPLLRVGVPLVVYPVALLNGGSGVCCVAPVFGLGPPLHIVLSLLHCLFPLCCSCSSFVLCCRVCCGWGSAVVCGGGTVFCSVLFCPVPLSSSVFVFAVTALLV